MGEILKNWLKQTKFSNLDQEVYLNIFVTSYFLRSKHEEVIRQAWVNNASVQCSSNT